MSLVHKLKVDTKIVVEATLSADDWQLYRREVHPWGDLRDQVATNMNQNLALCVSVNKSKDGARAQMLSMIDMKFYHVWGATDTAVIEVLDYVLHIIYD